MHVEGMGDASLPGSPLSSWTGSQCCSLDYWTLQPPPHPPTSQVPLLEHGCQYQAGCWPGGCWGTEAAGTREVVGMWLFPTLHAQPHFTGFPGGGAPMQSPGASTLLLGSHQAGISIHLCHFPPISLLCGHQASHVFLWAPLPCSLGLHLCFSVSLSFLSYSLPFSEIFLPVFLCLSLLL